MKKFPTSFAAIVMILAIMFFMLSSFMKHAEKDLKNLEKKRKEKGGSNKYEEQLNLLLNAK
ncbi:MAG TPA: hypothetical protein PLM75_05460 [bacterium]|nr:hypothetical protein [bacterium]HPP87290.1 hypothetical protein [bacterium]